MRTICITLPENPQRTALAKDHFNERGVENVEFFTGINGPKMGVLTDHPYNLDREPEQGDFFVGKKPVGIFLSHYMLWNAMSLLNDSHVFILEDDAKFDSDWKEKFYKGLNDTPKDFDVLFIGSCCIDIKECKNIKGNIYNGKYPMCSHAYIVAKKAIPVFLETNRDCYAPIDISVKLHSFPKLKVYTLLPRIVDQFNTVI